MQTPSQSLEDLIASHAERFTLDVQEVAGGDRNLRVAVLKMALRDCVWGLAEKFPEERHELAEFLQVMSGLVEEAD